MNIEEATDVMAVLTAAFPTYPVTDETSALYLVELERYGQRLAFGVVTDWVKSELMFPKVSELVEALDTEQHRRALREKALTAGQRKQEPGEVSCLTCKDTRWEHTLDEVTNLHYGRPCPSCNGARLAFWEGGHLDELHNVNGCDHAWCKAKAADKVKERKGRVRR